MTPIPMSFFMLILPVERVDTRGSRAV